MDERNPRAGDEGATALVEHAELEGIALGAQGRSINEVPSSLVCATASMFA
jgi:hypothetical protein